MINSLKIKQDFPMFKHHKDLVYLDSAATSLKPQQVIDKENEYYTKYSANIYRGIYKISEKATEEYENVRKKVAHFIGAKDDREIVFVRNATEAINLVASSWGEENIGEHDEIVATIMEHHANFVTWQNLCKRKKANLKIINIKQDGTLSFDYSNNRRTMDKSNARGINNFISEKTKLVAFTHISNVLGTINPAKEIISKIRQKNPHCLTLIDGAQAVPHLKVDVSDLGCDFYVFSSHKMLGPTGVGVLWGKYELLNSMPPYQFGGEMIEAVYPEKSLFKDPPHRFEAGTQHIAGVIGLGAAIDYLEKLGMENIRQHEIELITYSLNKLKSIPGLTIYGPPKAADRGGVTAFTIDRIHAHDIAQILDSNNICIRSGHHCAMPLHIQLKLASTARVSFYIYSTKKDVDKLLVSLRQVIKTFS